MGTFDSYQAVTDQMIAALDKGVVPWHKPWKPAAGRPRSMSTGNGYHGINVLLLGLTGLARGYQSPWWGTMKAINARGGKVREGQNRKNGQGSTMITFWKIDQRRVTDAATGETETKTFPMLRVYNVFNAEQCEGLPEKYTKTENPAEIGELPDAQAVLDGYWGSENAPGVHFGTLADGAGYSDLTDEIHFTRRDQFTSTEAFYSTCFHESVHSTGHRSRLNRPGVASFDHFGSEQYAAEELVAEMGSAFLCAATGVEGRFDQSASYVKGWLRALQDDPRLIVTAASAAEKAVALIESAGVPAQQDVAEAA